MFVVKDLCNHRTYRNADNTVAIIGNGTVNRIDVPALSAIMGAIIFHDAGAWFITPLTAPVKVNDVPTTFPVRLYHNTLFTVEGRSFLFTL